MRPIKFRAWDAGKKKMHHDLTLLNGDMGYYPYSDHCDLADPHVGAVHPTVMQYTGLKDVNGKEIYESDLVEVEFPIFEKGTSKIFEWGKEIGVVTWMPEYAAFWVKLAFESHELIDGEDVPTVVGNLYETPELLTNN